MLNMKKQSNPKLHRHVKAYIKKIKHTKQELKQEENKMKLEHLPPKKSFLA